MAQRKKKDWWDNVIDFVGGAADKIIPGDQSNWRSEPTRAAQVAPVVRAQPQQNDLQVAPITRPSDILSVGKPIQNDTPLSVGVAQPKPIVPVFDEKAVNERLDKGYSWEQIAKETNTDVNKVKEFSQKTRANYGVAQKDLHEYTDYRIEKTGNKKVLGMDIGQFMGDYGDLNKITVDQKTDKMTEQDLLKGYDSIGVESAKRNTGKQTQDLYTNKLKELAKNGDERAKLTLDTLTKNGRLKGSNMDVVESANNEFLGGLARGTQNAAGFIASNPVTDALLDGDEARKKWREDVRKSTEADKKNWEGSSEKDELGKNIGKAEQIGLDIGLTLVPAGAVDKVMKGSKVVNVLNNGSKLGRGASFAARTIPGSAVFTGEDITSKYLRGEDQNVAQSVAIGTAADLALPVAGKVISKIPGTEKLGGMVLDGAGNVIRKSGEVIDAAKNNVREVRNGVDDLLDKAVRQFTPPKPATVKINGASDVPVVSVKRADGRLEQYQPKTVEEARSYQQAIDDNRTYMGQNDAVAGTPDKNGDVWHISSGTEVKANYKPIPEARPAFDNFELKPVADPRVAQIDGALKNIDESGINTPEMQAQRVKLQGMRDEIAPPEPKMPKPMTEWADEYNGVDPRLQGAQMPKPAKDRSINADDQLARLRERAANPVKDVPLHEQYPVKPETVDRLVRDYGEAPTRNLLESTKDATNINNWDGFVVSEAQKRYGKVAPSVRVTNAANEAPAPRTMSDEELASMEAAQFGTPKPTVKVTQPAPAPTVRIGNSEPIDLTPPPVKAIQEPSVTEVSNPLPTGTPPESNLGKMAETFFDSKAGNNKIRFRDIENLGKQITREIDDQFKAVGSDFSTVARTVEEARRNGVKNLDEVGLTADEANLWRSAEAEMDYVRRRASLGKREVGEGDFGEMYFPNQTKDAYPTRDTLFEGFRASKPGNEIKRKGAIDLDELSFDPDVIGGYVTRYADTKLLQEERIYRAMAKNNPEMPEEAVRKAAQEVIDLTKRVNSLKTKIKVYGKKVTQSEGKNVDFAGEMNRIGQELQKPQVVINGTPRGLTNGDRLNSVDISDNGQVHSVGDFLGLNQYRDSLPFAGNHVKQAGNDREALASLVEARLKNNYKLPEEDVAYLVESIRRIKGSVPENVVTARVNSVYRNAAKSQLMEQLQRVKIDNKTLNNDVSRLSNQILREGSIEQELSAKVTQNTLRATNALFRKLNVSSAVNELSDLTSFVTVYGKNTKLATPSFKLIDTYGLGELDPAIEPFLRQVESGVPVTKVMGALGKINEGTRLYKFVETYKAGVMLKTAEDFYRGQGLTGDALTAKVLDDYRQLALPVDAFTKTFLDDFPLFTQYMTWGARNIQKEGRLLTGQIDSGLMKDKTTAQRIARDVYANIPAKTAFWLASNGLKGTTLMTAVGLTDFTGLTNQDYSGIAEEDKSFFDKTTQFTNISTIASLVNATVQSLEKEGLKEKYKDADYNPYENANFGDSFVNQYTPQFLKNYMGAQELQDKGYSENKGGRVQYEAPEDAWNTFKSYVFGKNQTENAREYSGRENLADRMKEGVDPFTAVKDMAAEQMGFKDADYNRPLTEDYSKKYKEVEEGARTALLQGGRQYNNYLDDMKKNQPDLYNSYVSAMDGNHVNPEYWRNIGGGTEGGGNLDTFHMMRDRKRQLQKDLGTNYDPMYDLPDDQAKAVLDYKATPTGTDIAVRNGLNKEQWYKDLKARQKEFYAANPKKDTDSDYTQTERVKQWDALDDQLGTFYYDAEEVKKTGDPAWSKDYPLVYEQKIINDKFGFGSDQSDAWFKANGDAYKAQKEGYDKTQLNIINEMRKIEGVPPMSWEGYQQANKVADTDTSDDKDGYADSKGGSGGGGGSISPNAGGSYSATGASNAAKMVNVKAATVKVRKRGEGKKIAIKRGGKI